MIDLQGGILKAMKLTDRAELLKKCAENNIL